MLEKWIPRSWFKSFGSKHDDPKKTRSSGKACFKNGTFEKSVRLGHFYGKIDQPQSIGIAVDRFFELTSSFDWFLKRASLLNQLLITRDRWAYFVFCLCRLSSSWRCRPRGCPAEVADVAPAARRRNHPQRRNGGRRGVRPPGRQRVRGESRIKMIG